MVEVSECFRGRHARLQRLLDSNFSMLPGLYMVLFEQVGVVAVVGFLINPLKSPLLLLILYVHGR
jgi:hypothetical protein